MFRYRFPRTIRPGFWPRAETSPCGMATGWQSRLAPLSLKARRRQKRGRKTSSACRRLCPSSSSLCPLLRLLIDAINNGAARDYCADQNCYSDNSNDLDCPPLIFETGHRRDDTREANFVIEAFLSSICVQNDLLVPFRKLFQFVDDPLAQTYALIIGMDCYITKIRAVDAVGQCAHYADQFLIIKYKALISAI